MWKSFIVLLTLVFFFVIFASHAVSGINLTNTPIPEGGYTSQNTRTTELLGGGSPLTGLSGQGGCGDSYTVRSGDTMSTIAKGCGVALEDLLAANPSISNPNMIHPGQSLVMVQPRATAQPGADSPSDTPTPVADQMLLVPQTTTSAGSDLQHSLDNLSAPTQPVLTPGPILDTAIVGVRPGGTLNVHLRGFPGNARVEISFGELGFAQSVADTGVTAADGTYTAVVTVPSTARPRSQWRVTARTLSGAQVVVSSIPFMIQSPE